MDIRDLIRPHLLHLKPYSSARDEYTGKSGVFLDANENPFGTPGGYSYHRYPDPYQSALKEKISKIKDIAVGNIFLGNGSDEAIDLLIRAFCEPNHHNVCITPPTYGMYEVSAEINNVSITRVNLQDDFSLDSDVLLQSINAHTRIIFLCSPNNPTGNSLPVQEVIKILKEFKGIVVVDEAYIDFSLQDSMLSQLQDFNNLVVIQTLSKAWGMAGLRLGMAFASADIINLLNRIKPPYNINEATQKIALEALDHVAEKEKLVTEIFALREEFGLKLQTMPHVHNVYPSDANFLLVKVSDARQVYQKLIEQQIIIRDRSKVQLCEGCLRISIGTPDEMAILEKALLEILSML
ncbi:MAG: histidinol-phosphate transaminase [Cyclobacteriaceae bacterium]|nr:histidinol-phosphate transaminase [Cyclobacteriaceae bacterium]